VAGKKLVKITKPPGQGLDLESEEKILVDLSKDKAPKANDIIPEPGPAENTPRAELIIPEFDDPNADMQQTHNQDAQGGLDGLDFAGGFESGSVDEDEKFINAEDEDLISEPSVDERNEDDEFMNFDDFAPDLMDFYAKQSDVGNTITHNNDHDNNMTLFSDFSKRQSNASHMAAFTPVKLEELQMKKQPIMFNEAIFESRQVSQPKYSIASNAIISPIRKSKEAKKGSDVSPAQ
jgi:hypothetical protein